MYSISNMICWPLQGLVADSLKNANIFNLYTSGVKYKSESFLLLTFYIKLQNIICLIPSTNIVLYIDVKHSISLLLKPKVLGSVQDSSHVFNSFIQCLLMIIYSSASLSKSFSDCIQFLLEKYCKCLYICEDKTCSWMVKLQHLHCNFRLFSF